MIWTIVVIIILFVLGKQAGIIEPYVIFGKHRRYMYPWYYKYGRDRFRNWYFNYTDYRHYPRKYYKRLHYPINSYYH